MRKTGLGVVVKIPDEWVPCMRPQAGMMLVGEGQVSALAFSLTAFS